VYPARPGFDVVELMRQHGTTIRIPAEGFLLKPGAFVLGWTEEHVRLPCTSRLAGRVEGRSSVARLAVGAHVTAPTIHAGFGFLPDPEHIGTRIRLEIWNCGPLHVCLETGMAICQLILEEVHGTPEKGCEGVFATQAPEAVPPAPTTSEPAPRKVGAPARRPSRLTKVSMSDGLQRVNASPYPGLIVGNRASDRQLRGSAGPSASARQTAQESRSGYGHDGDDQRGKEGSKGEEGPTEEGRMSR
jgi:deoxycytidine triphosphate deaminase